MGPHDLDEPVGQHSAKFFETLDRDIIGKHWRPQPRSGPQAFSPNSSGKTWSAASTICLGEADLFGRLWMRPGCGGGNAGMLEGNMQGG